MSIMKSMSYIYHYEACSADEVLYKQLMSAAMKCVEAKHDCINGKISVDEARIVFIHAVDVHQMYLDNWDKLENPIGLSSIVDELEDQLKSLYAAIKSKEEG